MHNLNPKFRTVHWHLDLVVVLLPYQLLFHEASLSPSYRIGDLGFEVPGVEGLQFSKAWGLLWLLETAFQSSGNAESLDTNP